MKTHKENPVPLESKLASLNEILDIDPDNIRALSERAKIYGLQRKYFELLSPLVIILAVLTILGNSAKLRMKSTSNENFRKGK